MSLYLYIFISSYFHIFTPLHSYVFMFLCDCSLNAGCYRPLQSKNIKWVLGIGILGSLGIGYWDFGLVGYWVLRFEIDSNTDRLGPK